MGYYNFRNKQYMSTILHLKERFIYLQGVKALAAFVLLEKGCLNRRNLDNNYLT